MKRFCRLEVAVEPQSKVAAFTSLEHRPRLLALPSRPMSASLLEKFETDADLQEGLGMLKNCQFYEFDRVFVGQRK